MTDYAGVKEWRKKNPDKVAAQVRRYNAKHPDKRRAISLRYRENNLEKVRKRNAEAQMKRRNNDPEAQRRRALKHRKKKRDEQDRIAGRDKAALCELCNEKHGRIVFDHCHNTGKFRGWICDRCNKVLGLVYDNPRLLKKLATYLKGHQNGKAHIETKEEITLFTICRPQ